MPRSAGRNRGPSDLSVSRQGYLDDPLCTQTRSRVAQDNWSTRQVLGPKRKWPGNAGRPVGPRTPPRVTRDCWSSPRAFRHGPEALRTTGQHHPDSGTVPSCRGQMVYPTGPRTRARVALDAWSNPRSVGYTHKLPGTAGPLRGPSGIGSSRPGCLLETTVPPNRVRVAEDHWSTTGPRTLTGVTWDSWSTLWALRPGPESRRRADRPRGLSEPGTSCPGVLVDTAGPRTRARVSRVCWSTPQDLGPKREWPRISGRARAP